MDSLLSLNEDGLCSIVSYVHGTDALNLSLTCRRVHDLAIHRVAAVILCDGDRELRLLHRYMFFGSRPRAHYLESLILHCECVYSLDHAVEDLRPMNEGWDDAMDWSQNLLLYDLLTNAPKLRHLQLPVFQQAMQNHPQLGDAVCAIPHLTSASFDIVDDSTVRFLETIRGDLRSLMLGYSCEGSTGRYETTDVALSLDPLLGLLEKHRHLRALHLLDFIPTQTFTEPSHILHSFPALRTLVLITCDPIVLDLVPLFPNVSVIEFNMFDYPFTEEGLDALQPSVGAPWPPLRVLDLGGLGEVRQVQEVVSSVHLLEVRNFVPVAKPHRRKLDYFMSFIRKTSPVGMRIALHLLAAPMQFWPEVLQAAPDLRFLELKLALEDITEDCVGWLDRVPDALRMLPLVSLRVLLPRLSPQHGHNVGKSKKGLVRRLEEERSTSLVTLPRRLAEALPTLRFVAVYEAVPSMHFTDDGGGPFSIPQPIAAPAPVPAQPAPDADEEDSDDSDSDPGRDPDWPRSDSFAHGDMDADWAKMGTLAHSSCWRVRPTHEGPELEQVPELYGDRVRYFFEDAEDVEAISKFEDVFP
ncbi:hypothetical protein BD413DRAFT_252948 [Trametes elegans]|nr:hypothetical protein BD413DRAFT_252948 [Trametes elegans]